jgi:hypothetical protein
MYTRNPFEISATTEHVVLLRDYDETNDTAVKLEQLHDNDEK